MPYGRNLYRAFAPLLALALFCVGCASFSALEARRDLAAVEKDSFSLSEAEFRRGIDDAVKRVKEFAKIAEWGEKNGVRIWAAGGTATGLAVYEKQRLEQEWRKKRGMSEKYFSGRFSDSYFDIYRSTQDADIIINGSEADAQKLEAFLESHFNYLEGSKSVWEVRLLSESRGVGEAEKDPLLGFDFQNQNSDSFSTGLVELTTPPVSESRIRDLFDWKNQKNPKYLSDILGGTVSFYRNSNHFKTKRAAAGNNPEILSAIRALTKAFQYESTFSPEDHAELKKIIDAFDPQASVNSYVANQISKNGQKIFFHSPDVERAWLESSELGLRQKLIEFGRAHKKEDLALWLDKSPLRTKPLGVDALGNKVRAGKTARELGIQMVSHETNSFLAYENISRSLKGKPNVFESRSNAAGENAAFGDGFYTKVGKSGARGTGLTIRFQVVPEAVDGVDFVFVASEQYVVFRNASALRVIDESLNLSAVEYFRVLANGEITEADKGLQEKLKLKLNLEGKTFTPGERREILEILEGVLKKRKSWSQFEFPPALAQWFAIADAALEPKFLERVAKLSDKGLVVGEKKFLVFPEYPQWMEEAIQKNTPAAITALRLPEVAARPEFPAWFSAAYKKDPKNVIWRLLSEPELVTHPNYGEWIKKAVADRPGEVLSHVLSIDEVTKHPDFSSWMDDLIKKLPTTEAEAREYSDIVFHFQKFFSRARISKYPRFSIWMKRYLRVAPWQISSIVGYNPELLDHPNLPEWIDLLVQKKTLNVIDLLSHRVLYSHPKFSQWIDRTLGFAGEGVLKNVLKDKELISNPNYSRWMNEAIEKLGTKTVVGCFESQSFSYDQSSWPKHPQFTHWWLMAHHGAPDARSLEKFLRILVKNHPQPRAEIERVIGIPFQDVEETARFLAAHPYGQCEKLVAPAH